MIHFHFMGIEDTKLLKLEIPQGIKDNLLALCKDTIEESERGDGALVIFKSPRTGMLFAAVAYWTNPEDVLDSQPESRGEIKLSIISRHPSADLNKIIHGHMYSVDNFRPIVCSREVREEILASGNGWEYIGDKRWGVAVKIDGQGIKIFTSMHRPR